MGILPPPLTIGRFISSDPAKHGTNWYAYCRNNPLNSIDPLGLFWREIGSFVGGIIGGMAGSGAGGIGALPGGAIGSGIGGSIGSLLDGNSIGQSAVNGVSDGVISYIGGWVIGKVGGAIGSGISKLTNCFVEGTPVQLADGTTKPIEQIKPGDKVLSKDQFDQAKPSQSKLSGVKASKVVRTFVHEHAKTLVLHVSNGENITTTPGHPFYVKDKGWVIAGELSLGNAIVTRAGPATKVISIQAGKEATVYNFEVEATHTYFIGETDGGLWVHNASVALDTNAVIALLEGSQADQTAIRSAIGGRTPLVPIQVVKEYLDGRGGLPAFMNYLVDNGGRVIGPGDRSVVSGLISAGVKGDDAEVVGSAIKEGVQLLTRDKRLLNKIPGIGVSF